MNEIIEIELDQQHDSSWRWHALNGPRHNGTSTLAFDGLRPGDRLIVEVRPSRATWQITRVIRHPEHARRAAPTRPTRPSSTRRHSRSTIEPGDIVLRRIRFSAAGPDRRTSKLRPCVVIGVEEDLLEVLPVYGSNSATRRQGDGRRLLRWADAGLHKPCVVSGRRELVPAQGGQPIGQLEHRDRRRVLERSDDTTPSK